jgi:glycosyltransferase involved in cell wall biosynthesis
MSHSAPPVPPAPAGSAGHVALLSRVPLGIRSAVLVGGGRALEAALRRRDPAARILVLDDPAGGMPDEVDAIIWPDALAREADPRGALRRAAQHLSPDGVIVIGVPNGEHWSVLAGLIRGGWQPGAAGPVEPGHLRLLTPEAVRAAIEGAGLVALEALPQAVEEAAANEFTRAMAPALQTLGIAPQAFFRRTAPRRYLWRAARRKPTPLVIVAHVLKPVGGVNDVRIDLPLGALATRPGVVTRIAQNPETPELPPDTPRIMLLHRRLLNSPDASAYVDRFRRAGWVVVQEFDDDPAHWPVIEASNHFAFRGVHAVQTTTRRLEALFRAFNDEVAVFPNTVAELPEPVNFADPRRLTLFLGALRREEDTAPFLPVLNEVLAEADGRLQVEMLFDRGTFDALRTPHKRFQGILPYAEYRALMARCEIAFLPLNDTRFNNFKSDLKFVEAGAHRLCAMASPVVYGDTVRDGETGLILRTPEQFGAALRRFLAKPEEARTIGDAARAWVRENRLLAGQVEARLDWYRSLWARRAELDAAMLRRAPEYARLGA